MKKIYGIIGAGDSSAKAVATALGDLEKDAVFYIPFSRSLSMETVYDWLIDNERDFVVIGNPGKVLRQYAAEVHAADMDDININVLKHLQDTGATVLVLWEDGIEDAVMKAHAEGHTILELSNGLAPITIEDDEQEAAPVVEPEVAEKDNDEEEVVRFSREELESMPVSAVKRYATNMGMDIKGKTKDEIIDTLFPVATKQAPVIPDDAPPALSKPLTIVVIMDNGSTLKFGGDSDTLQRMISAV